MIFQNLFAAVSGLNLNVASVYYIAIAVLACVLGAEIAGICILVNKIIHAQQIQNGSHAETQTEEHKNDGTHMFAGALLLGAVPAAAQSALLILAIATAVAALIFVVLLVVFRVKGYSFVASVPAVPSKEQEVADKPAEVFVPTEEPVSESAVSSPAAVGEEDPFASLYGTVAEPVADEEQAQEEYTAPEEEAEEEISVFDADADAEELDDADEPVEEIPTAQEEPAVTVIPHEEPAGMGQAQPAPGSIPIYSSAYPGGQAPVIEKHITETYKEIIRETTTTNTDPSVGHATEEILKAIAELMKLEVQNRMDREMAVENSAVKSDESVPTFAAAGDEADVEDVEEEDDADIEDADGTDAEAETDDDYESELFSGNERIVGFDEETGCYIVAHYRKSFEAKLIQARPNTKKYYSELKNALLSYEGTHDRITWTINSYQNEHTQIAKINVRNRTVDLYLALDPASLEDSVYHGKDVSDKKKYAETPFLYKVNSPRKLSLALELVRRTCEEQGLSPIDIEPVAYEEQYPFEATEDLVRRGLIREYLREEKPAVTFELAPDHEPMLPEEDGSVIPANANFTWEFDNDRPDPEPEPQPEVAAEPRPEVPEPTPTEEEPAAAVSATVTHETVKTVERHYTEHIYSTYPPQPDTAQVLATTAAPIEALAEPIAEEAEPADTSDEDETLTWDTLEKTFEKEIYGADAEEKSEEAPEEENYEEETEEGYEEESYEEETEEGYEEETYEEEAEEGYEEESYEEETEEGYEEESYEEETEEGYEEEAYEEEAEEGYEEESYEEEAEEGYEEESYEEEAEEGYEEESYEEEAGEGYEEESYEEEAEEGYEEETYEEEAEEGYEEDEYEETYVDESEGEYEDLYEEYSEEESEEEVYEEEEEEESPSPAPASANTTVALLDVCLFDDHFENGAIVNLETLKQVGLAPETAKTLKVYASGPVKGRFTVEANHFTLDAIKSIGDADGDSIMIR